MGSFGIFFLCLTFFYLLYYAVMILMDIYGKKARQTDGVEEFKVGGGAGTVENPDQVLEREDGGYEMKFLLLIQWNNLCQQVRLYQKILMESFLSLLYTKSLLTMKCSLSSQKAKLSRKSFKRSTTRRKCLKHLWSQWIVHVSYSAT